MKGAQLLAAILLLAPVTSSAQSNWNEEDKLVYEPGSSPEGLGEAVSLYEERALLGAPALGVSNFSPGYAVVADGESGSWLFAQLLEAEEGELDDRFGFAVALAESLAVVGAPEADFMGDRTGAAYVFGLADGEWIQQLQLLPVDGSGGLEFGSSVAVFENTVLVGAPEINIGELETGEAYIFEIENGELTHSQQLRHGDFSFVAGFGQSVALEHDLAVIGTPNRGEGSQNFGSVFLYERIDESWEFRDGLEADDAEPQDLFGSSVAVDGNWLFAAAPGEDDGADNSGAVYVFRNVEGVWTQEARLKAPTPMENDHFGESVAVSGGVAVVGTSDNDDRGAGAGTVFVFEHDGSGWQFEEQLFASDASVNDRLARSVAVDGDVIVAGAAGEDGEESEESVGAAYFFRRIPPPTSSEEESRPSVQPMRANLYPNPVADRATLRLSSPDAQSVRAGLYDLLGRRVKILYKGDVAAGSVHHIRIETDDLSNGAYFIRVRGAAGTDVLQFYLSK